jgi:hypothetical protein
MELPEQVLYNILREGSENVKAAILHSLAERPNVRLRIVELVTDWLKDNIFPGLTISVLDMLLSHMALPAEVLVAVVARLED